MNASDETIIIGGGPAGMLLAHLLVEVGERVHVIERHPDFSREFRGEGIQASVVQLLRELGLLDELLDRGIARPARSARVFLRPTPEFPRCCAVTATSPTSWRRSASPASGRFNVRRLLGKVITVRRAAKVHKLSLEEMLTSLQTGINTAHARANGDTP